MPILTCTTQRQMLDVAGVNLNQHKQDGFRHCRAAAFGVDDPVIHALALDAVALAVRDYLAESIKRRAAAAITRAFSDDWQTAVAHTEHTGDPWAFAAAELFVFGGDRTAWWCARGPVRDLQEFLVQMPEARRLVVVRVGDLMAKIRKRAADTGLDWSAGTFYVPPDHPFHVEWAAEFKAKREAAIKQFDPLHTKVKYGGLNARQRKAFEALV